MQGNNMNRRPNRPQQKSGKKVDEAALGKMLSEASGTLGTDADKIKNAINSGKLNEVTSKLSPAQAQMLGSVMQDEAKMKQLLSTPQAQALLKKLFK